MKTKEQTGVIRQHFVKPERLKEITEMEAERGFKMVGLPSNLCQHCGMIKISFEKITPPKK